MDEATRQETLEKNIEYGNHKSILRQPKLFQKKIKEEVKYGSMLPLPLDMAFRLPDAEAAPHGLVSQDTINGLGEIVPKDRLTHDQSYGSKNLPSVNSRIIDEELAPCFFGHMISRCIHYIVGCCQRLPSHRIWISKIDWRSAYRRQHLHPITSKRSITQITIDENKFILLAPRLTFGGKPYPSEWGCVSEPAADLVTDILSCEDWSPQQLHSPQQNLIPEPSPLPHDIPFGEAKETIVNIPHKNSGKCDVYIDDMVVIRPDIEGVKAKLAAAAPLAIHTLCRPLATNEEIPREIH